MVSYEDAISESARFIEGHLDEVLTVEDVAAAVGYSSFYFSRIFKEHFGMTVMEYVRKRRLSRAYNEIVRGTMVTDAALNNGYASHSGFTKAFRQAFGFSPALLKVMHEQLKHLEGECVMKNTIWEPSCLHMDKDMLFERIILTMKENGIEFDEAEMKRTYLLACDIYKGLLRYSGEAYVTHTLNTALIAAQAGAEAAVVMAAMLCDCLEKTKTDEETLYHCLPKDVVDILVSASKGPELLSVQGQDSAVLVKLAERLHNMRTLEFMDSSRFKAKAKETIEVYLPLAKEIGSDDFAEELYALSARYLV